MTILELMRQATPQPRFIRRWYDHKVRASVYRSQALSTCGFRYLSGSLMSDSDFYATDWEWEP